MSTEQDVSQWHKKNGSFVAIWFILLWVFCGHLVYSPVGLFVDKGLQKDIAAHKEF